MFFFKEKVEGAVQWPTDIFPIVPAKYFVLEGPELNVKVIVGGANLVRYFQPLRSTKKVQAEFVAEVL